MEISITLGTKFDLEIGVKSYFRDRLEKILTDNKFKYLAVIGVQDYIQFTVYGIKVSQANNIRILMKQEQIIHFN